jgi:hypothetical protein
MATATAVPILNVQSSDNELAKQTVFIKVHLGLLGNTRKVSPSQVEVDADKALFRVSKTLLDSPELQAVRALDGDVRHFLYDMGLPFDVGIHLFQQALPSPSWEELTAAATWPSAYWKCDPVSTFAGATRRSRVPHSDSGPGRAHRALAPSANRKSIKPAKYVLLLRGKRADDGQRAS